MQFELENPHPNPTRVRLSEIHDPLVGVFPPRLAQLEHWVFCGESESFGKDEWVYLAEFITHLNGGGATGIEGQVDTDQTFVRLLMPGERLVFQRESTDENLH